MEKRRLTPEHIEATFERLRQSCSEGEQFVPFRPAYNFIVKVNKYVVDKMYARPLLHVIWFLLGGWAQVIVYLTVSIIERRQYIRVARLCKKRKASGILEVDAQKANEGFDA